MAVIVQIPFTSTCALDNLCLNGNIQLMPFYIYTEWLLVISSTFGISVLTIYLAHGDA